MRKREDKREKASCLGKGKEENHRRVHNPGDDRFHESLSKLDVGGEEKRSPIV